ncbi:hypothetical protein, partial [Streptomyces sp. NPDC005046]
MLSAPLPGTVFGVPVSLALCAAAVLVAILLLVMVVAWVALRRVEQAELPVALLVLQQRFAIWPGQRRCRECSWLSAIQGWSWRT